MSSWSRPVARMPRADFLTGLRWWAAFGVFCYHMANLAPLPVQAVFDYGNFGVTFFFVLSGFVLTWAWSPTTPATTFWWRRVARIYPAHLVALLLAIPVFYSTAPDPDQWWVKPFGAVLLLSIPLLQGWSRDPAVLFSGNPAAWTLTCEMFFYAAPGTPAPATGDEDAWRAPPRRSHDRRRARLPSRLHGITRVLVVERDAVARGAAQRVLPRHVPGLGRAERLAPATPPLGRVRRRSCSRGSAARLSYARRTTLDRPMDQRLGERAGHDRLRPDDHARRRQRPRRPTLRAPVATARRARERFVRLLPGPRHGAVCAPRPRRPPEHGMDESRMVCADVRGLARARARPAPRRGGPRGAPHAAMVGHPSCTHGATHRPGPAQDASTSAPPQPTPTTA